jgi:toxin ParE1/3/4
MPKIIKRIRAKRDLTEQFAWLGQEAGVETAIRFRNAARQTFVELLRMPGMGTSNPLPEDPTIRRWRIRGFEKYLIFY